MPVTTIRPDEYVTLEYKIGKPGLVGFNIEATRPVKSYVLGPKSLQRFESGSSTFRYYGGYPDERAHQAQKVWLAFSGPWYLVISNPDKEKPVEVEYDVYY